VLRVGWTRGDIVIWAILAMLGVPLWLIAIAILVLVFRNRGLRKRALDIPMRLRVDREGRWHRGHGLWVHDVLAFRGSPAAWQEGLLWVTGVTTRELTPDEVHKFRRLDHPVMATFTVADGPTAEAVTARPHRERLFGPYQGSTPQVEPAS